MKPLDVVVERIIEKLDKGIVPWRKTWESGIAQNGISGHCYKGINALLTFGYASNLFYTFNQVKQLGGYVHKGAKGIPIVYWQMVDRYSDDGEDPKKIPFMKYYIVFNQLDTSIKVDPDNTRKNDLIVECEKIVDGYKDKPSIMVGEPAYSPSKDILYISDINKFESATAYYDVLFHELNHSTLHASRLNRKHDNYDQEELVAEFGTAILCAKAGIQNEHKESNNVAYIQSWSRKFKEDKRLIITLASQAQKSADYILGGN